MEESLIGLRNYSMSVQESGDKVHFLRKLIPGAAGSSYGVYCARLAGLPDSIIDRANTLLEGLEHAPSQVAVSVEQVKDVKIQSEKINVMNPVEDSKVVRDDNYDHRNEIKEASAVVQLSIFGEEDIQPKKKETPVPLNPSVTHIIESVKNVDLMNMTPLQAMQLLLELSVKAKGI